MELNRGQDPEELISSKTKSHAVHMLHAIPPCTQGPTQRQTACVEAPSKGSWNFDAGASSDVAL
jgi:hypothetical protein